MRCILADDMLAEESTNFCTGGGFETGQQNAAKQLQQDVHVSVQLTDTTLKLALLSVLKSLTVPSENCICRLKIAEVATDRGGTVAGSPVLHANAKSI